MYSFVTFFYRQQELRAERWTFGDLMRFQRYLDVSGERDRVYGVLVLFPNLVNQVDYQKTADQIYEDATATFIANSAHLDAFAFVERPVCAQETLASWAVNIRRWCERKSQGWAAILQHGNVYSAAAATGLRVPLQRDGKSIRVEGMLVSRFHVAAAIGPPTTFDEDTQDQVPRQMAQLTETAIRLTRIRDGFLTVSQRIQDKIVESGRAICLDIFLNHTRRFVSWARINAEDFRHLGTM